jgi:hypothetical protein
MPRSPSSATNARFASNIVELPITAVARSCMSAKDQSRSNQSNPHAASLQKRTRVSAITAVSGLGIEIANEVRKSGTRLEPIIYRDARLARHLEDFCL